MSDTGAELAIGRGDRPWLGARGAAFAAATTGALFALAQPPVGWWPLALVCLAPLVAALGGRGLAARARIGALAGALAAGFVAVGPAAVGTARFFDLPLWQGWALALGVGELFGVVGFTVFAVLAGDPLRGSAPLAALRAGLAFAAAEFARSTFLGGLPWLLLAHALAPAPPLIALAPFGGIALLSAWLAALATAALRLARDRDRRGAPAALACGIGIAAAAAFAMPPAGGVRVAPATAIGAGAHRIALVQPALPIHEWTDPTRARDTVRRLTALSLEGVETAVDLVVWPENAVQALLPANEAIVRDALAALEGRSRALLLGAPRYDPLDPTRRFNAALLYRGAASASIHDKSKLLPIFESTPRWLARFARDGADLTPGSAPAVLDAGDALRVGPLLCYEVLFPAIARAQVRGGAGVLVNLSNDAWFAGSGGAEQHFAAAVLLAATTARPLLRATPTGVTGAIDAAGRVVARLPLDRAGVLAIDVAPAAGLSPALRLGGLPDLGAAAFAIAWTALGERRAARRSARN